MMLSAHLVPFGLTALLRREPSGKPEFSGVGLTCYTSLLNDSAISRQDDASLTFSQVCITSHDTLPPGSVPTRLYVHFCSPWRPLRYSCYVFLPPTEATGFAGPPCDHTHSAPHGHRGSAAFAGSCRPFC